MSTTRLTSRQFNQDTSGAKRAARSGPVYITSRGKPSHVLLTFEDYLRLSAGQPAMTDLLGEPAGIEDVQFEIPAFDEPPRPAELR
jgi:prevent-host-death family protein